MAEIRRELQTDAARATTGTTTDKESERKESKPAKRKSAAPQDGAERLRSAADRRVRRNSKKLVDVLVEKALKGDVASTRALVMLAGNKKPRKAPEKRPRGLSWLERLAMEPQWKDPEEEGSSEAGQGGPSPGSQGR